MKKKLRNQTNNLKKSTNNWRKNGKKKENNSLKKILKTQLTELLQSKLGIINMKDLTKTNLFGSNPRVKSLKLNIKIFTKMFSRIQAILLPGHISKPKVILISLVLCIFLKELHMTNSKSFMKRKMKLNFLSEEFWSMINLKICYQNIWISSKPLLIPITCL